LRGGYPFAGFGIEHDFPASDGSIAQKTAGSLAAAFDAISAVVKDAVPVAFWAFFEDDRHYFAVPALPAVCARTAFAAAVDAWP
jgi:hypothetical protein